MIDKNVLLFWDRDPVPEGYAQAVEFMHQALPAATVVSLNDASAAAFLKTTYGHRHEAAFQACTMPAMRSDLIRLAWIAKNGGLYVDWRFRPQQKAYLLFKKRTEELVCFTMQAFGQRIVANGVFLAPADSNAVRDLMEQAFQNVWQRKLGSVSDLTGPGLFTRYVDAVNDPDRIRVFGRKYFFTHFFENSQKGQHGFTADHWFSQQAFSLSDLYRD